MFKKLFIAGIAVAAGFFILRSTHLGAYARTAWHKVQTSAKKQVPIEFQLDTVRNEAAQLIPDMKNHIRAIAMETVAVQQLKDEIAESRSNLEKQKKHVSTLNSIVKSGKVDVDSELGTKKLERNRAQLAAELASCQYCTKALESKEQLLEAKQSALDIAKAQLVSMRSQKEQLELSIAQLEAEIKTVRLAETRSNFQLDDSRLTHIKASLADIRNQLRAKKIEGELMANFDFDTVTPEMKKSAAQLTKEADEFLGEVSTSDTSVKR